MYPVEDVFHEFAPYFAEHVRSDVVNRYGNRALLKDGLKVSPPWTPSASAPPRRRCSPACSRGQAPGLPRAAPQLAKTEERKAPSSREAPQGDGRREARARPLYVGPGHLHRPGRPLRPRPGGPRLGTPAPPGHALGAQAEPREYYPARSCSTSVKRALRLGDVIVVQTVAAKKDLTDDREQFDRKLDAETPDGPAPVPAGAGARAAERAGLHRPAAPVPRGDGRRLRLRRQRVQPRLPGLPPARQHLQAVRVLGGHRAARVDARHLSWTRPSSSTTRRTSVAGSRRTTARTSRGTCCCAPRW